MKHIFISVLLWIGFAYVQAAPIYEMTPPDPLPMRSMQIMTSDIRYTGVTYAPFTAALPSEQSAASESSSGRPTGSVRRGKILGPDTPPADESPIGEPWILAVFAILFAGVIIRKNNSNMKNMPSIKSVQKKLKVSTKSVVNATKVLSPILLFAFLTLGFGQAWADTYISGGQVKVSDGGSDYWRDFGSTNNLGTKSALYVDGFWVELTGGDVCKHACLYYWLNSESSKKA